MRNLLIPLLLASAGNLTFWSTLTRAAGGDELRPRAQVDRAEGVVARLQGERMQELAERATTDPAAASGAQRDGFMIDSSAPGTRVGRTRFRYRRGMAEAYLVGGVRTPVGRYGGALAGVRSIAELGIPADSTTETFAAIRVDIHTRRWAGVPFTLRSGKALGILIDQDISDAAFPYMGAANITVGGSQFTDVLQRSLGLNFQQAEAVKRGVHDAAEGIEEKSIEPLMNNVTEIVAMEIQKTFDFYRATTEDNETIVQKILISGGGSKLAGLAQELSQRLELPVEVLDPFRNIKIDTKKFDPEYLSEIVPEMAVAVGLAMRGV